MASDEVSAPKGAAKYKSLISQFINGQFQLPILKSSYLKMLKNEAEMIGGDAFDILEDLFTSADDYVADPELRSRLLAENFDFHNMESLWTMKNFAPTRVRLTGSSLNSDPLSAHTLRGSSAFAAMVSAT
jgi:hypothetical protein